MTKQELIERIIETIYENVTQDITGDALQGVLRDMVGSLVTADELNEEIENEKDARESADELLQGLVDAINAKIPSAASASNQLADKAFVNSSIATGTATFRGTSAKNLTEAQFLAWANTLPHDLNDYIFWDTSDTLGNQQFKRYKYTGSQWQYEYTLNNSTFTAAQWAAINSGLTSGDKEALDEALEVIEGLCAPAYTIATTLADLVSGEDYKVAFGKIAKAVNSLISHLNDNVRHITSNERTAWNNKKDKQTPKASPETDGEEIAFIDTITQDAQGVITATRKEVREASSEQSGVVSTDAQSFSGNKTFDDALIGKKGVAAGGATSDNAIGGSGVTDHRLLEHRDANNQHPISAITDLEDTLDELSGGLETEAQTRAQNDQAVLSSAASDASSKVNSHNASNNAHSTLFNGKVDKVEGKGLSTEDYTTAEKSKLDSLHNYDDTELRVEDANIHIDIIRESNERKTNDAELKEGVIENAQAIQAEEGARVIADNALSGAINSEKTRAEGVENELVSALQNKKDKQTEVDVSGSNVKTITRLQQNAQGVVTPTFADIPSASASQKGLMDTTTQTFGGNKTFNGSVISQQGVAAGGSASDTAIGTSGTTDHRQLTNRDAAEQHPISAITNLQTALDSKQGVISDLGTIRSGASAGATAYQKPSGGIPKTDLASAVQTSLGKADSALQQHQSLDGYVNGITTDSTTTFADSSTIVVGKSGKNILTRTAQALFNYIKSKLPSWSTADTKPTYSKSEVGLGNVDNTSDINKPISTATQTALNGKVDKTTTINGHALSGNVTITKGDVGLGSVDNTSDLNKPISTATQNALTQRDIEDANIRIDLQRESNERKTNDAELKTDILNESATRASEVTSLTTAISNEVSRAQGAESTLTTAISNEATSRSQADLGLATRIGEEETAREVGDTTLENALNSEKETRAAADSGLATRIGTEESTRASADDNIREMIGTETTNRTNADASIRNDMQTKSAMITAWLGTPDHNHYPSAKLTRDSIDVVQSNLTNEATTRANTDLALQVENANQNIDIQREVHERKTNDAELAFRTSIVKDDLSVVTPSGVAAGGVTSDAGLRPYKFITQISATGDISQNIVHNLGSADVVVTIHKNSSGYWQPDSSMYRIVDNNTINVYPYSTGTYRITIIV